MAREITLLLNYLRNDQLAKKFGDEKLYAVLERKIRDNASNKGFILGIIARIGNESDGGYPELGVATQVVLKTKIPAQDQSYNFDEERKRIKKEENISYNDEPIDADEIAGSFVPEAEKTAHKQTQQAIQDQRLGQSETKRSSQAIGDEPPSSRGTNTPKQEKSYPEVQKTRDDRIDQNTTHTKPVVNPEPVRPSMSSQQANQEPLIKVFYFPMPDPQGFFWDDKKTANSQSGSAYKIEYAANDPSVGQLSVLTDSEKTVKMLISNVNMFLRPVCEIEGGNTAGTQIKSIAKGRLKLLNGKWVVDDKAKVKIY